MSGTDRLAAALEAGSLDMPPSGRIVALRARPGPGLARLDRARLVCEQSFRPVHDRLAELGITVQPRVDEPAAAVLVALTRSRAENFGAVARGLAMLPEGGRLVIDGAKVDGADSLARQVGAVLPLAGQLTKGHGRLVWLDRPAVLPKSVQGWAAEAAPRRNREGFLTMAGLFSPDAADPGSRRLATYFAGRLRGRVADLGAGWGWLAQQALERAPAIAQIDLYEAEARALDMARENVADTRAGFHWSDVETLGRGIPPYDAVIANPPFHQGRAAEPVIGAGFIAAAARILKPSGLLLMVANRQLPYEAVLEARFRQWERLAEDGGYKVVAASRPRRD